MWQRYYLWPVITDKSSDTVKFNVCQLWIKTFPVIRDKQNCSGSWRTSPPPPPPPTTRHPSSYQLYVDQSLFFIQSDRFPLYLICTAIHYIALLFHSPSPPPILGEHDEDQDSFLVKRRNDNHSPVPVIRELVPRLHQRSELSSTILCIFSRWDQRIGEGIPIPDSLGEEATSIWLYQFLIIAYLFTLHKYLY